MNTFGRRLSSSSSTFLIILNFITSFNGAFAVRFSTVLIERNGDVICSGSFRDPETVLTAASCVLEGKNKEYRVWMDQEVIKIAKVKSITRHLNMDGDLNDIAMLHLETPAKNKNGKTVTVKGRFPTRVYDDKVIAYYKPRCVIVDPINGKDIEVDILTNSQCSRDLRRKIEDEQICVTRKQRKKCPAGLGNPVVCRINDGAWVQIAIHIDDSDCSSKTMVATRVSKFRSWMRTAPEKNKIPDKETTDGGGENGGGDNGGGDSGNETETGSNGNNTTGGNGDIGNGGNETESNGNSTTGGNEDIGNSGNETGSNGNATTGGNGDIGNGGNETESNGNSTTGGNGDIGNSGNETGSNGNTTTGGNGETGNGGNETTVEPTQRACNVTEFRCSDGSCIPDSAICDGKNDCPCGIEDESTCGCPLSGTEFITGFLSNVGPEVSILYISAPEVTSVTVSIPCLSYEETKVIQGAEKWSIEDTTLIIGETTGNKGVHITSDKPITVVAANSREFSYTTVDGTIVYPVDCLSTDYLVETQNHRVYKKSQYAIIGTKNATDVTIVNQKGKVFNIQLGFLDTYFLQEKDLRGTSITATSNVVVMSGSECGYVPSGMSASCDHLVNQIPPRSTIGNAYIVSQQKPRTGFSFRIKAMEDNTTVVVRQANGDLADDVTLDVATEYVQTHLDSQPLSIKANKGVMVTQYALDCNIDGLGQGDPSMVVLPALNAFDTIYEFVVPDHFLRIGLTIYISACHDASGLLLNGKAVSTCGMTLVSIPGYGDYNVINVDLDSKWATNSHAILSHSQRDVPFGVIMYGTRVEGAFAWRIGGKL